MSKRCPHCGKSLSINSFELSDSSKAKFWKRVKKMESGCWEWQSRSKTERYGRFNVNGNPVVAHRVAWIIQFGSIPEYKILLHSCDNPKCCNTAHLKVGTDSDNMRDMVAKGRDVRQSGSFNSNAKFTESDILEIRRLLAGGKTINEVAVIYRVTFQSIYQIGRGWTWKHVPIESEVIKKRLFQKTPEQISEIRRLWTEEGWKQKDIAAKFDLWRPDVSYMLRGVPKKPGSKWIRKTNPIPA